MIKYSVVLKKQIVVEVLADDCDEAAVMAESYSDAGNTDEVWKKALAHFAGVSTQDRPSVVGAKLIERA